MSMVVRGVVEAFRLWLATKLLWIALWLDPKLFAMTAIETTKHIRDAALVKMETK